MGAVLECCRLGRCPRLDSRQSLSVSRCSYCADCHCLSGTSGFCHSLNLFGLKIVLALLPMWFRGFGRRSLEFLLRFRSQIAARCLGLAETPPVDLGLPHTMLERAHVPVLRI